MIFNTWAYYLLFLIPSAALFRLVPPRFRPWVIVLGGSLFFLFFSYTTLGGFVPEAFAPLGARCSNPGNLSACSSTEK